MIGKQINGLVSILYSIGVKCVNDKIYISFRDVFRNLSHIYDEAFYEDSGFQSLTIFAKSSIINAWQGSEYVSKI